MMKSSFSRMRLGWGLAGLVVFLDQATKWYMLGIFNEQPSVIKVLPFFNLVLAWNRGISFGMFGGAGDWGRWILIVLALIITVVLAFWLARAENKATAISLGLIIGGALGNVIDRVRIGAVFDFLDVFAFGYHWPAFNVADSAITVGAIILILESLFLGAEKPKKE